MNCFSTKLFIKWTLLPCLFFSFWTTPLVEALEEGKNSLVSQNLEQKVSGVSLLEKMSNLHSLFSSCGFPCSRGCRGPQGRVGPIGPVGLAGPVGFAGSVGPTGPIFALPADPSPATLTFNMYLLESVNSNIPAGTELVVLRYVVLPDQTIQFFPLSQIITTTGTADFHNLIPLNIAGPVQFGAYNSEFA